MFHFGRIALSSPNIILIISAVVPALALLFFAYRFDRVEKESPGLLWSLVVTGVFSCLIALVLERIFGTVLDAVLPENSPAYPVVLYFGIVALSEEGAKYLLLRNKTWNSTEFNYRFDAVVYAVFVSLGFALWENITYVLHYRFSTALVRALTAIPGHAAFGVFMGAFYGLDRQEDRMGREKTSRLFRILSIACPALLHGTYDYIASTQGLAAGFVFFVLALFLSSFFLLRRGAREDRRI
ncbi:MAG: PrsW family intramembrane metalloprotease [Clostridia bacterium]|nr:PrsW family intramembrane metalloprotease [Clostridia bacterium]